MIRTRREPPKRRTLDDIFAESDELGLLNVAPPKSSAPSADQRLVATLQGIEAFVTQHGREPQKDAKDLNEATLAVQLAALRSDPAKVEGLAAWDALGLLGLLRPTLRGSEKALMTQPSRRMEQGRGTVAPPPRPARPRPRKPPSHRTASPLWTTSGTATPSAC
jgi:hypothetical protein